MPAVATEITEEENTLNRINLENTTIVHVTKTTIFWDFKSSTYRTVKKKLFTSISKQEEKCLKFNENYFLLLRKLNIIDSFVVAKT